MGRGETPPAHCWAFSSQLDPESSAGPQEPIPRPFPPFVPLIRSFSRRCCVSSPCWVLFSSGAGGAAVDRDIGLCSPEFALPGGESANRTCQVERVEKSTAGHGGWSGPELGVGCRFRWVLREGSAKGCGNMIHSSQKGAFQTEGEQSGEKPEAGACPGPSGR